MAFRVPVDVAWKEVLRSNDISGYLIDKQREKIEKADLVPCCKLLPIDDLSGVQIPFLDEVRPRIHDNGHSYIVLSAEIGKFLHIFARNVQTDVAPVVEYVIPDRSPGERSFELAELDVGIDNTEGMIEIGVIPEEMIGLYGRINKERYGHVRREVFEVMEGIVVIHVGDIAEHEKLIELQPRMVDQILDLVVIVNGAVRYDGGIQYVIGCSQPPVNDTDKGLVIGDHDAFRKGIPNEHDPVLVGFQGNFPDLTVPEAEGIGEQLVLFRGVQGSKAWRFALSPW